MSRPCTPRGRDRGTFPNVAGPARPPACHPRMRVRRPSGTQIGPTRSSARPQSTRPAREGSKRVRGGRAGLHAECLTTVRVARGHARSPLATTRSPLPRQSVIVLPDAGMPPRIRVAAGSLHVGHNAMPRWFIPYSGVWQRPSPTRRGAGETPVRAQPATCRRTGAMTVAPFTTLRQPDAVGDGADGVRPHRCAPAVVLGSLTRKDPARTRRGRPPPRESGVRPRPDRASDRPGRPSPSGRDALPSGSRGRSRSRPAARRHRCPCRTRRGCSSRRRSSAARRRPRGPPRSAGPGCCGTG